MEIFNYSNYRLFLEDFFKAALEKGLSYRKFAKSSGISSPNYFQQVISNKRNLTTKNAGKVARGLGLTGHEAEYFVLLVRLEHDVSSKKEKILEDLKRSVIAAKALTKKDEGIFSCWLHQVIYEMASLDGFEPTVENVHKRLQHIASRDEVLESLSFLKKGKYLDHLGDDTFLQNSVIYELSNDVRRIDLQKNHLRFLELAKHRINDDKEEREFQGLTIAIPKSKMPVVKNRIREFMDSLCQELMGEKPLEAVIRVQCCAYKVTTEV